MTSQQEPTKQELKNIVGDFSHLIMDCSEIRNNFCSELPTEDGARHEIAWRNLEKRCSVPDLPNEEYLAFKRSIPKEEVNKFIDEAKRGKKLWDGLESRLSEIRQRLKDPAFNYLPEIFTSVYCPKLEHVGQVLTYICVIEKEFKGKNPVYANINTPYYETVFKDFLINELRVKEKEYLQNHGKEIEALNPADARNGTRGKTEIIPFPTPQGAKWSDVYITFNDGENVSVKVKDISKKANYIEMGFNDKRQYGSPKKSWDGLKIFAHKKGLLTGYTEEVKDKIEKDIQELKEDLAVYFKIEGNPIPYFEKEGYKTEFKIEGNPPFSEKNAQKLLYYNLGNHRYNQSGETDNDES